MILQPPVSAVVPVGARATFTCVAVGNVFWSFNDVQIATQTLVDLVATQFNVSVPLSTPNRSEVIVDASIANNGSTFQCLVEDPEIIPVLNRSAIVQLQVLGECIIWW